MRRRRRHGEKAEVDLDLNTPGISLYVGIDFAKVDKHEEGLIRGT
jgi:hypothetical protein